MPRYRVYVDATVSIGIDIDARTPKSAAKQVLRRRLDMFFLDLDDKWAEGTIESYDYDDRALVYDLDAADKRSDEPVYEHEPEQKRGESNA